METVNFQCGHCGNLMAVDPEHLGQQVHCPHCQQVVVAPPPAGSPPPAPPPSPPAPEQAVQFPKAEEPESIFSPPEAHSDALFDAPPRPVLELPPAPPMPSPALFEQTMPAPSASSLVAEAPPQSDSSNRLMFAGLSTTNSAAAATGTERAAPEHAWHRDAHPPDLSAHTDYDTESPARVAAAQRSKGWVTVALIVPLISYAILATILILILYHRQQNQPHPLEMLPDLEGENVGTTRRVSISNPVSPEMPLPSRLKVALGSPIRVGDLQVTPLKVEQRRVQFVYAGGGREKLAGQEALVLHLRLQNLSENVAFKPMDPFFQRGYSRKTGNAPYTYLEMGVSKFYGAVDWVDGQPRGKGVRAHVEGQDLYRLLQPNESMDTLVCTDPAAGAVQKLLNYKGKFLWRVQLRRGLVPVKHREMSATAVIGVEFSLADIQRKQG